VVGREERASPLRTVSLEATPLAAVGVRSVHRLWTLGSEAKQLGAFGGRMYREKADYFFVVRLCDLCVSA